LPALSNLDLAAFYACSGATTAALVSQRFQTEPAQLNAWTAPTWPRTW
jgi:hypothetical protein